MSGIAGIFQRDGKPVTRSAVNGMLATIAHRGGDGWGVWTTGEVGLGHRMLWTTPESLCERLPYENDASGITITCDARIDNRSELIEALGLCAPPPKITDSALILAAYEKWGEGCPSHLIGDFVFVIWDRRAHRLVCARDPMGVKCLYYFCSDNLFVFASEIKAIVSLPEVPRRLNEQRVLDYMVNLFDDRRITFYRDVYRLPGASVMTVSRDKFHTTQYWSLDPHHELRLSSDAEYTEAFRACFTESVRCRIRSAFPVGSALSGGLDSSAIACTARQLRDETGDQSPLDTFSLIFPGLPQQDLRYIDERKEMDTVLRSGTFRPHFVHADQLSPLKDVNRIHWHLDEAFFAGNLYLHWALYSAAKENGVRIFLDGLDGDTTVSHGFEYLADLIVSFRWKKLLREIRLIRQNLHIGRKRILTYFCIAPFCPTWVYTLRNALHGRFGDTRVTDTLLNEDFKQRLHLTERVNTLLVSKRSCLRNAREKHWEMLNAPLYAHALELADKASGAFQVEARYPFFDRRLLELCLSLPANQKLGQGWSRLVLRRAMQGILPPEIQWRPAKGNLSPNFYSRLLNADRELLDAVLLSQSPVLAPYVDAGAVRQIYEKFSSNPRRYPDESVQVFATVNLAVWLQTAGITP